MSIDFDALDEIEFDMDEELMEPTKPTLPMEPIVRPVVIPTAFSPRAALTLIEEPDKLFDFSGTKLTPQQQMYIMAYAVKGTQAGACRLADVHYQSVKRWMQNDEFVEALQNAVDMARDSLEEELIRRAMNGSDRLLLAAVKAAKPEKYQPKTSQDVNIHGSVVHSWAELAKAASGLVIEGEVVEDADSASESDDGDDA